MKEENHCISMDSLERLRKMLKLLKKESLITNKSSMNEILEIHNEKSKTNYFKHNEDGSFEMKLSGNNAIVNVDLL